MVYSLSDLPANMEYSTKDEGRGHSSLRDTEGRWIGNAKDCQ